MPTDVMAKLPLIVDVPKSIEFTSTKVIFVEFATLTVPKSLLAELRVALLVMLIAKFIARIFVDAVCVTAPVMSWLTPKTRPELLPPVVLTFPNAVA